MTRPAVTFTCTFPASSDQQFLSAATLAILRESAQNNQAATLTLQRTLTDAAAPPAADKKGKKGAPAEDAPTDAPSGPVEQTFTIELKDLVSSSTELATALTNSSVSTTVTLGHPLAPATPPAPPAVATLVGPPEVTFLKSLKRDVFQELRAALDTSIDSLVSSYATIFLLKDEGRTYTRDMKLKRLMYHLNKNGGYFEIKEALKPCLQRIVMQKVNESDPNSALFKGRAPILDTDEGNAYVSHLFMYLTSELNNSLMRRFVPDCVEECR